MEVKAFFGVFERPPVKSMFSRVNLLQSMAQVARLPTLTLLLVAGVWHGQTPSTCVLHPQSPIFLCLCFVSAFVFLFFVFCVFAFFLIYVLLVYPIFFVFFCLDVCILYFFFEEIFGNFNLMLFPNHDPTNHLILSVNGHSAFRFLRLIIIIWDE